MQDRYVGDVGDYGKYGLLRLLASPRLAERPLRLAVMWYLVPERHYEANDDGRHVGYLGLDRGRGSPGAREGNSGKPPAMRECDPELFDALRRLVAGRRRKVAGIEKAGILPPGTAFFGKPLHPEGFRLPGHSRPFDRGAWMAEGLERTRDADIVFLDPDNGIEPKSVRAGNAPKYALWRELREFHDRGQSLLVYHHLGRTGGHEAQIRGMLDRIREEFPGAAGTHALRYRRGTSRAFLIIAAGKGHDRAVRSALARLRKSPWMTGGHFSCPAEAS